MKRALLVIDVQESFRHRPYWQDTDVPAFLASVQNLIDGARERGVLIAQIFHQEPGDDPTDPFTGCSGFVRPLQGLSLTPDAVFHKQVHSAMFGRDGAGQTLEAWLRRQQVEELLITGIRTEQCCETTTRHASDLGFKVRYVSEATLTFPMRTRAGRLVTPAELRERTELVLDGRFASIVAASAALA